MPLNEPCVKSVQKKQTQFTNKKMKKLKLDASIFAGEKALTREQLKKVMGGAVSSHDCLESACSLTIQLDGGEFGTKTGTCAQDGGLLTPLSETCYCNVGLGHVPVTSNSGVSRCTR
jgi:hypothetical protein